MAHTDTLMSLLTRYQQNFVEEVDEINAFRQLIDTYGDEAFVSSHMPAHITVSAWVVLRDSDYILLRWHKKVGDWIQAGGHIESSDANLFAAVQREVLEETDYTVQILSHMPLHLTRYQVPPFSHTDMHWHYDLCFVCLVSDQQVGVGALSNLKWVAADLLPTITKDDQVLCMGKKWKQCCTLFYDVVI